MSDEPIPTTPALIADRREVLRWTSMLTGASALGLANAQAQPVQQAQAQAPTQAPTPVAGTAGGIEMGPLRRGMLAFTLAHEQFRIPQLLEFGAMASRAGFNGLATSDHFQPWQANQGHSGLAWVTMGALGAQTGQAWMGTAVTCPTLRYSPAVVAEAFSSLSHLYPGRVVLGVGSGEALNEQAATGQWPKWQERWDRLIEAIAVIRALWGGQQVEHKGNFYTVNARLYDAPAQPIPILTAANGKKSMRLAGIHGDGLISDPQSWKKYKSEWEAGARSVGKDPATMPVMLEQFVVVGGEAEAREAAEMWRFTPKAWKGYYDIEDPRRIQQRADAEVSMKDAMEGWAIGTDPAVHIAKIKELRDSGVSVVNIHSGQMDLNKVIDFYGKEVLPHVRG